jgi:peptidoglycan/xylan/chitin deacetylase (PgdA/CDA1 family)
MHAGLKHRLIAAGFAALAASRTDRLLAPLARGRGVILMFHHVRPARRESFQPNALLEITPDYLELVLSTLKRAGLDLVSLDEVPARLASAGRPFAALTFDDGYRDNVEHGMPILDRHGAPWTMFVTADYASGCGRLWWLELEEVVRRSETLSLDEGGATRVLPARTPEEKHAAFAAAYASLRAGTEERLRDTILAWCRTLRIDGAELVRRLCLGWDELADLARRPGVTIGAHTLTHPMLAKHERAVVEREIAVGGAAIAHRLGVEVRHLSYPVGDPTSAGPREFAMAREAGFVTAVTTRPGHLHAEHIGHLTALPRVSVNGLHQSEAAFRSLLSGVPFLLWNRGRRLNVG